MAVDVDWFIALVGRYGSAIVQPKTPARISRSQSSGRVAEWLIVPDVPVHDFCGENYPDHRGV